MVKVVPTGTVNVFPTHIAKGDLYVKFELAGNVRSSLIQPTTVKPFAQIDEVTAGPGGVGICEMKSWTVIVTGT